MWKTIKQDNRLLEKENGQNREAAKYLDMNGVSNPQREIKFPEEQARPSGVQRMGDRGK